MRFHVLSLPVSGALEAYIDKMAVLSGRLRVSVACK